MKTAEQIAEKLWEKYLHESLASRANFLAALKEYGEAVRDRAAGVCAEQWQVLPSYLTTTEAVSAVHAAILRMELP